MNWTSPLDEYCERLNASFWAEPINALTNFAFLLAAACAYGFWCRQQRKDWPALVLIIVVMITGIGSFLYHTFANVWSALADVIPIALFIHIYLFVALNRFLKLKWWLALLITLGFLVFSPQAGGMTTPLVGTSSAYVPALAAIFVVGLACLVTDKSRGGLLILTGFVFTLSVFFRTIDGAVCAEFPLGTHFLWHLLNSAVLFMLLWVLMRDGKQVPTEQETVAP